jgi:hypothetical protein
MLGRLSIGSLAVLLLVVAGSAGAAPEPDAGSTHDNPIPSPQGLIVRGPHGYTFVVNVSPGTDGTGSSARVEVHGPTSAVTYAVKANLAGEGIRANFGRFGRIDLRWKPDGKVREVHGHCGRRPTKFFFAAGAYVGTVRLRAGGGASSALAHRIPWNRDWYQPYYGCLVDVSEGLPGPGVVLEAGRASEIWDPIHLFVFQSLPGKRVVYNVRDFEKVGRIGVTHAAYVTGGPKTLTVGDGFRIGEITPPAPFSGSGRFERIKGAKGTWLGDLTVEFLDGFVLPLAGRSFEAVFHSGYHEERVL